MDDYGTIGRNDFQDSIRNGNVAIMDYKSCIIIIVLLAYVSFNIGGLYVGATHENKNIISLVTWLILVNTVGIIGEFLFVMSLIFIIYGHDYESCGVVFDVVCGIVIASIIINLLIMCLIASTSIIES